MINFILIWNFRISGVFKSTFIDYNNNNNNNNNIRHYNNNSYYHMGCVVRKRPGRHDTSF